MEIQKKDYCLQIVDDKVMTTSINVASIFSKRHDDVLRAIRNEISSGVSLGTFAERDYDKFRFNVLPLNNNLKHIYYELKEIKYE